jgi:hypothetical protein
MTLLIYDIKYELIGYIFVNSFIFLFLRFNKLLNPHFFLWVEDVVEWPAFPVPAVRNWHAAGLGHSTVVLSGQLGGETVSVYTCLFVCTYVTLQHPSLQTTPNEFLTEGISSFSTF